MFFKRVLSSLFLLSQIHMGVEAQTTDGKSIVVDGIVTKHLSAVGYEDAEREVIIDTQFKADNPNFLEEALKKPVSFRTLGERPKNTEDTCGDFLRLLGEGEIEPYNHEGVRWYYFSCQIDYAISQSKALEKVIEFPEPREHILAKRLNLKSFPNSIYPRITADTVTLDTVYGDKLIFLEKGEVHMVSKRWHTGLAIHAILDVNHNGKEDWIIVFHDDINNADYFSPRLMLILDVAETGLLNAQEYDPHFDYIKMMGKEE